MNVHSSLLPRHRGSAPINWAIMKGDRVTGVTTMFTDIGMDTGDMLLSRETPIGDTETAGELSDRLAVMGAELLVETLRALEAGTLTRTPQNPDEATYEPKMDKALGLIDWSRPAREIDWLVRGTTPWPGAYTTLGEGSMKVFEVRVCGGKPEAAPGTVLASDAKAGLVVACGDAQLELVQIQMPGARRMNARDYLRGHAIEAGIVLGQ